jgi:hypothetical protein
MKEVCGTTLTLGAVGLLAAAGVVRRGSRAHVPPDSPRIVEFDVDEAKYLGGEEDGVYWMTAQGPDGWYVTVVIDSDTGGFVENLETDAGPFSSEGDADQYGRNQASDWLMANMIDGPWE